MRTFRPLVAFGCIGWAGAIAAGPAQAQSGLFVFAPGSTAVSTFTTNPGGTLTSTGTVSGGGFTGGFMSLMRGDQAFAYQTYNGAGPADSIQVINTATQSVVQTVAVTGNPNGMVLNANGSTLYVANNGANTVSAFSVNTTTGMLTQTGTISIGAGNGPRALALSSDGTTLYAANQTANTVSVVNLATNAVTTTIPVGTQPTSIAINPAGTRLYVGNATSANVSVINTATNTVTATVNVGGTALSIGVSPNGQFFYVTATNINTINIYDAASNSLVGTAASASSPAGIVISPDGTTLYVTNGGSANGQAFSINPSTGLLTSLGFFSTAGSPLYAGMCGNGSSANGMLASGGTFFATSNGALGCAGSSATMTGGTLLVGANNLAMNTPIVLGALGGTFDTNGNNMTLGGAITGTGNLTKTGLGTLTLTGNSTYSGATFVNVGTLQAGITNAFSVNSSYNISSGATLDLNGFSQSIGSLSGAGNVTLGSGTLTTGNDNTTTTFSGVMSGSGGLTKIGSGTLFLTGANTFTGPTTLNAGGLTVNGSLTSPVTVNGGSFSLGGSVQGGVTLNGGTAALNGAVSGTVTANGGTLSGAGTFGGLAVNGGTVAPGNSIGTVVVNGNFAQSGGVYQVEVAPTGQSDLIAATGTATISGGTVQVVAQSGIYARNTTYTILTANGGVNGAYSGVSSNFAFLTPLLSYGANNVFLTLAMSQGAFASGAQTPNQFAVGTVLDQVNSSVTSGNFNTVLNALANLTTQQGPQALNQISGQPYADFGTVNVQGSTLFMNAVGQQLAGFRGGASSGQRQALAEACDGDACQAAPGPWGTWVSGLGGFGNVSGNFNSSTLTYNFIGTAAGIDYRFTPNVLLGIAAGYTYGQQWVDSFFGKGWSNTLNVTAYGSFTLDGFYADALAGYAYSNNQLQRQIFIPGLQPLTANGSTGANQFLGQVETGYKIPVFAPAATTVTPFARLQLASVNQAAFSEWGANSLSLNVAQQTTNSVRTTFGTDLGTSIGLGKQRTLDMGVRVGWLHEFADTGRPMTAAFAGAPANGFTVYGATPQRDSAVIGLRASSYVADATQLYFRYDGELGGGSDNHVFNVGVRLTW